jgi:hypothetical protein
MFLIAPLDARRRAEEHAVNVFAVSTPHPSDWRWRIVDAQSGTLEESSRRFPTIAATLAAGTEQLQRRRDRDRPTPAHAPRHRGR